MALPFLPSLCLQKKRETEKETIVNIQSVRSNYNIKTCRKRVTDNLSNSN